MGEIYLDRIEGPKVYRPSISTTRTTQEFGKTGEEKTRAVLVTIRNLHTTATITVYIDRETANGEEIGPGESWFTYFERGLKNLPLVSDTVNTTILIKAWMADFGSETQ